MGKGNGGTKSSTPATPNGTQDTKVDVSKLWKDSGMLDLDKNDIPTLKESDFKNEDQYYLMTDPMPVKVNTKDVIQDWDGGLTGGENGWMLYNAKKEILKEMNGPNGKKFGMNDIEYDDGGFFTVWHRDAEKPGDTQKSFFQLQGIQRLLRFRKDKKSGYLSAADKNGVSVYGSGSSPNHSYKFKIAFRGDEAY